MKILLDECVPAPLARLLADHECRTAREMGWDAVQNGALLRLAEREFHLFLTSDQNIRYQQNLEGFDIAIVELSTNNLRRIEAAPSRLGGGQDRRSSSRLDPLRCRRFAAD